MPTPSSPKIEKRKITPSNLYLGAFLTMCEASTLGQPIEVVKTTMSANRDLGLLKAIRTVYKNGGLLGYYQGLIPWAWIEACTKGSVLLFVSSEIEYRSKLYMGLNSFGAGVLGGMSGGVAQAYTTMGFCTCMKTVEITRRKAGANAPSTWQVFSKIWQKEGWWGINKGVNAVAIRQLTNWGSRFGFSRLAESGIKKLTNKNENQRLSTFEKIAASFIGGGLSAWNQPIEVIRVEMQSKKIDPNRPKNMTMLNTLKYIYSTNGFMGLYRGVTPRIGLSIWQTIFMVSFGDMAKEWIKNRKKIAIT